MKIIRYQNSPVYSPDRHFPNLRDEMDRLFDAAFPALSSLQRDGFFGGLDEFPIDLYQEKNSYVVRAEVPGFAKEDLGVEVQDGILTVTAHHKTEPAAQAPGKDKEGARKENAEEMPVQERRVTRSIALPDQVELDGIQAKYENGILTVTLPKKAEAQPRQVAIEVK